MDNEVWTVELRPYSERDERNPRLFPVVFVCLDVTDVVYFSLLTDKQRGEMSLTTKKAIRVLSKILKVDEWQMERDSALRRTELYGTLSLIKIKRKDSNGMVSLPKV